MSMLSRVSTPTIKPPRIVIHGRGGSGKTTLAASTLEPIFLPCEDGLGILDVPALPKPTDLGDVMLACEELLKSDHGFRTLAIDTIDHLEPLIWSAVCAEKTVGKKVYESIEDFGYGKGYLYADPYWVKLFRALDALRSERGMTICVLCHNEMRTVEDPALGPYTRIEPKLHKRANALLYEWADIVGYLDVEMHAVEREGSKGRVTVTSGASGRRLLHLEDRGGFAAKNRFGLPSPIQIPEQEPYSALRTELRARLAKKDS